VEAGGTGPGKKERERRRRWRRARTTGTIDRWRKKHRLVIVRLATSDALKDRTGSCESRESACREFPRCMNFNALSFDGFPIRRDSSEALPRYRDL